MEKLWDNEANGIKWLYEESHVHQTNHVEPHIELLSKLFFSHTLLLDHLFPLLNPNVKMKNIELAQSKSEHREDVTTANSKAGPYAMGTRSPISPEENRRLFWKVNSRILPIMVVTYFCQSLDKGTLGFSSIMGIQEDTHLVGQQVCFEILFCSRSLYSW